MTESTNVWIETFTGKKFDPINPNADTIDIVDIAHALSHICRYSGHTPKFYSVAQHSVFVALLCPKKYRLWGLLHDAAETYISDIPRPAKQHLPTYKDLESRIIMTVAEKFKLPYPIPEAVKDIDNRILKIEHRDVMNSKLEWDCDRLEDLPLKINQLLSPEQARMAFLWGYEWLRERE